VNVDDHVTSAGQTSPSRWIVLQHAALYTGLDTTSLFELVALLLLFTLNHPPLRAETLLQATQDDAAQLGGGMRIRTGLEPGCLHRCTLKAVLQAALIVRVKPMAKVATCRC
jgi:hypothetical protein